MIQGYGAGKFRIAGQVHEGSVLVFAERTVAWSVGEAADITLESLAEAIGASDVDILIIGCGAAFEPPPKGLREGLKEEGVALEWMDTGAACRTFNVLLAEDRAAAVALIAIE